MKRIFVLVVVFVVFGSAFCFAADSVELAANYIDSGNIFNKDGANWCADFIRAICDDLPVEGSRSAKAMWNQFRNKGLATKNPESGDLIFFWRESKNSWKGHVGIIEKTTSREIVTIEGNVRGRVVRRVYQKSNIPKLLGFGKI
ncbi:MAG: putative peptidoglycan-binding domain-containing protein [Parcubacteria group bacterium Athens1014_10]|nr:MAG: putative peptidoglycan-binding domain-containing protein [Parcubacteria group bacterium Athens1014_10]TSD04720.1 MAG: putative peptidoglycan-binding domain-containing protein [Parcubacteria group bacterium Athens0714_12]